MTRLRTQNILAAKEEFPKHTHLHLISKKIRSIGYWIESQGETAAVPEDIKDINWGTALMLEDIANEVRYLAEELEKQEQ